MRIRQQRHERKQLDEGARPAVTQNERHAVPMSGPLMNEVNVNSVELGAKVMELVQAVLLCAPVEIVGPVAKQLPQVVRINSPFPGFSWCARRPARITDTLSKIG